jgi:hypothetical protein
MISRGQWCHAMMETNEMDRFAIYNEAFAKALATASVIAGDVAWDKTYCEHLKSFFDQWPAEPSMEAAHNHAAARSGLADYSTLAPVAIAAIETLAKVYAQLKKVVDDTPAPLPYREAVDIEDTVLAPNVGPLDVVSYAPAAVPTIDAAPLESVDPAPADGVLDPDGLPPNDVAPPVKASKRA